MAGLGGVLPLPTQRTYDREDDDQARRLASSSTQIQVVSKRTAPPYGHRRGWLPRSQEDYGDGGAFPELHIAQYPLGMAMKKSTSNALATQLDATGKIKYDVIARHGHSKDKVIHSKFQDLVPKQLDEDDPELQRPDDDAVRETTEKTRMALEKLVQGKISAAMPVRAAEKQAPAQYIRYTPSQQGVAFNSGAKQRIIRMVEVQKDPMEPPRFKTNKKIPRGPPSPPAPVMHSPNRKVTVKEQQEWKIPPCISNWKNAKGYTVPARQAGWRRTVRGLQGVHINENFAKLAEALYIADRKAREAVETRAKLEKQMAQKDKEKREESLRLLAQKAREERAGIGIRREDKDEDLKERDDLRRERRQERQRDRNLARAAPDKRSRVQRDRDRDISEKIALGMPSAGGGGSGEVQFDQRLFNQSRGMSSGFGDDEAYNVYDKPWRGDRDMASSIYRPSKNIDKDVYGDDLDKLIKGPNRFVPDKGFEGSDRTVRRDGPVEFRREEEEDLFGLNKLLSEAKKATKRPVEEARSSRDYDKAKKRRE